MSFSPGTAILPYETDGGRIRWKGKDNFAKDPHEGKSEEKGKQPDSWCGCQGLGVSFYTYLIYNI